MARPPEASPALETAQRLETSSRQDWRRRDLTHALSRAQEALALREKVLGARHPALGTSLDWLGQLHFELAHFAQSEALYRRALALQELAPAPHPLEIAETLEHLAALYVDEGWHDSPWPTFATDIQRRKVNRQPFHSAHQ